MKKRKPSMDQVDIEYFRGYEDLEIHREMLRDEARCEAYRAAINEVCAG